MKVSTLIANVAAALLTFASVSAINYNVVRQPALASVSQSVPVTDLAPVQVFPNADERRAAALLTDVSGAPIVASITLQPAQDGTGTPFQLLESDMAMPYYSFGKKFGRVSKE